MKTTRMMMLIAPSFLLFFSASIFAVTITITDLTDGAPVIGVSGLPAGSLNGCASPTFGVESVSCSISIPNPLAIESFHDDTYINLYEDRLLTRVSDRLLVFRSSHLASLTEDISIEFASDVEGVFLTPGFGDVTFNEFETGLPQLFTIRQPRSDIGAPVCTGCVALTVSVTSDVDAVPVPEPVTLALVGLGLAGMGLSRRRHLRKS